MYIFGLQIGSLKSWDKTEKPWSNSSRIFMCLDYIPAAFPQIFFQINIFGHGTSPSKHTVMKLYSGQLMWEMRLKQRTQCTINAGSVTTSLGHSRGGNHEVCWAKEGALQNVWVLSGCPKGGVVSFCDGCQLCGALPRRTAKKWKSNLLFFPGLWRYWFWPLGWCKSWGN